jgi:alkylhydroperoxidase family enzyme
LRPLLALARKLTLDQSLVVSADVRAAHDAFWGERAVHDCITVVALFNFINRYAHGHGVTLSDEALSENGKLLQSDGYDRLIPLLEG